MQCNNNCANISNKICNFHLSFGLCYFKWKCIHSQKIKIIYCLFACAPQKSSSTTRCYEWMKLRVKREYCFCWWLMYFSISAYKYIIIIHLFVYYVQIDNLSTKSIYNKYFNKLICDEQISTTLPCPLDFDGLCKYYDDVDWWIDGWMDLRQMHINVSTIQL